MLSPSLRFNRWWVFDKDCVEYFSLVLQPIYIYLQISAHSFFLLGDGYVFLSIAAHLSTARKC